MATGLLALFDDVAMLLDDVAVMSKLAAKKTAGLLGDDLAVNAEKATGFHASRELPVIWAISKGALLNKVIILPTAFLLSAFLPWLIAPILLIGGAYLCYEGAEKVLEWFTQPHHARLAATELTGKQDILHAEAAKIKAAIRTDFILSIEIIVIALETVLDKPLMMQVLVVSLIAFVTVLLVYGVVALLVRMDDVGLYLLDRAHRFSGRTRRLHATLGNLLVQSLPKIIRLLAVIGTIAMLLVGGGLYVHNIDSLHHLLASLPGLLAELGVGLLLGLLLLAAMQVIKRFKSV